MFILIDYIFFKFSLFNYSKKSIQKNPLINLSWEGNYEPLLLEVLKKSDILFTFNNKSFLSWLVRYFTKTEISHTGVYIGDGKVLHSTLQGSKIVDLKSFFYDNNNIIFVRHKKSQHILENNSFDIEKLVGIPYSYKTVFFKAIRFIFGYFYYQYRITYFFDFTLLVFLISGFTFNIYFLLIVIFYIVIVFIFFLFRNKIGIDLTNPGTFYRYCYTSDEFDIVIPNIRKMNEDWFVKMFNEKIKKEIK